MPDKTSLNRAAELFERTEPMYGLRYAKDAGVWLLKLANGSEVPIEPIIATDLIKDELWRRIKAITLPGYKAKREYRDGGCKVSIRFESGWKSSTGPDELPLLLDAVEAMEGEK